MNSFIQKIKLSYEKFVVVRVEEVKEQMSNLIVFQTVTDSESEFTLEKNEK